MKTLYTAFQQKRRNLILVVCNLCYGLMLWLTNGYLCTSYISNHLLVITYNGGKGNRRVTCTEMCSLVDNSLSSSTSDNNRLGTQDLKAQTENKMVTNREKVNNTARAIIYLQKVYFWQPPLQQYYLMTRNSISLLLLLHPGIHLYFWRIALCQYFSVHLPNERTKALRKNITNEVSKN